MEPQVSNVIVSIAMCIVAVAVLFQAAMVFGMYKAAKELRDKMNVFLPKAEVLLGSAEKSLNESRAEIKDITTKARTMMDAAQTQLTRIDTVVTDATGRAKVQLERVEMIVDDTLSRVHGTVMELNDGVLRPVREVNALALGVRAALSSLLKGGRPSVAQATADEEMFI
ncbi:MAG: hypothetical protein IPJ98_12255 [Bryobacterales bacterium]|nr:hypothetical protein [Bryobacterales bacterium]